MLVSGPRRSVVSLAARTFAGVVRPRHPVPKKRRGSQSLCPAPLLDLTVTPRARMIPFQLPGRLQTIRKRMFYWRVVYYYRLAMQHDFFNRK